MKSEKIKLLSEALFNLKHALEQINPEFDVEIAVDAGTRTRISCESADEDTQRDCHVDLRKSGKVDKILGVQFTTIQTEWP